MIRNSRKDSALEQSTRSPSKAWLFAQAILGKPIPDPSAAARQAQADREQLKWLASISTRHEDQLRALESMELQAGRDREQLGWLVAISTEHEPTLRKLVSEKAEARVAQQYSEWLIESLDTQEAWDASKHPRLGGPPNPGWWASTGGFVGATGSVSGAASVFRTAAYSTNQPTAHIVTVSDKKPSTGGTSPSNAPPSTKSHLPADHRGTWVRGSRGHGTFRYNDSPENQQAGVAGKEVRFENQHIAVGGFPPEMYYGGSAAKATVTITNITGTQADNAAADAEMRRTLKDPNWERPTGYRWNHAGEPGSKKMELVYEKAHGSVAHKGPAAIARSQARARGNSGRAMSALTVYLVSRDVLQISGVLKPDFEVAERETYHFRAEDGSEYVVIPAGWFSSPERHYLDGPKKGQTEKISSAEVEEHRKKAEEEFGKYTPGSLIKGPRFIPGKQRSSLPIIIEKHGIPYKAGWIDEDGVHYYPDPIGLPI